MGEFIINKFLTLKLEHDNTIIYIKGERFDQCKFLLLNIPIECVSTFDEIDSIDEAGEYLDNDLEAGEESEIQIPPETEFWAHSSNLQTWYEHNYDSRLLHRNLAFPLLKRLTELGDPIAERAFREEIAKRLNSGYPAVVNYLIEEKYIDYLDRDELLFNLLFYEEAEVIRELEQITEIKFEILYDFEEYKRNSIVINEKHVIRLDIYETYLQHLPDTISQLGCLKDLFLRYLGLRSISENVGKLNSLEWMDLSYNQLQLLPESIANLQNLKKLYLEQNSLVYLPEYLGNLKMLEELNLNDNNILKLPDSISKLPSLRFLELIHNSLIDFPKEVVKIKSLRRLKLTRGKFRIEEKNIRKDLSILFYD